MQTIHDVTESSKQKLTLGIDRKVIEKAKAAGINISAITEQMLTAHTYEPNDGNTRDDVVRAYQAIFDVIKSRLSKYDSFDLQITVGEEKSRKVFLHSGYGLLLWDDHGKEMADADPSVDSILDILYKPTKILEEFIVSITGLAEENKEKLAELKFALRLVKALSDDEGEDKK
jgi:hypothetical protein